MTDEIIRMTGQSADFPLLTAFLLGLIAALNPCQLAINVSAFTWLFSRSSAPGNTLKTGLLYLLGRFAAFFAMGWGCTQAFSYFDLQMSALSERFANIFLWVERLLPFVLLLAGLFFMFRAFHRHKHNGSCHNSGYVIHRVRNLGPFMLGVVMAFLFCPESALIFFGMMVPMGTAVTPIWAVPLLFSFAALTPFVLLLWIMRRTALLVERYESHVARIQVCANLLLGVLFILLAISIWFFD